MIEIPMTQAQFDAKRDELKAQQGIELTGTDGSIAKSGVEATYSYDGLTLKVGITKKPFLVSMSYCETKLREWLGSN